MNWLVPTVLAFAAVVVAFVMIPAGLIARSISRGIPLILFLLGAGLMLLGRSGIGLMVIMAAVALWRRWGGTGSFGPIGGQTRPAEKVSTVRSAALEMELNHETGAMNGMVLAGRFEGQELDSLEQNDLILLYDEIRQDPESIALLDAYLDRRFSGWRENAHFDRRSGQAGATGSGPMGEEEAYEVLGLAPGASGDEIRKAHRRLMKGAHPDSGGSTFLAAKINQAKDVLLKSHS